MPNNSMEKKKPKITRDHKILAKNSIYSFFNSYFSYFSALCTSFLMARLISQEDWGLLILALSYVGIASMVLGFLPPGLGFSYNYYIPRYFALNQNNKIKSFIKISICFRFISAIVVFTISFFIFYYLSNLFINLEDKAHLLLLLSPLVMVYSLEKEFLDINRSFNQFNIVFILIVIKNSLNIGTLLFYFLFVKDVNIEIIALITLFTSIIPFIINVFIILTFLHHKLKRTEDVKLSFKEILKNLSIYGSQMNIQTLIISIHDQIQIQSIGTFIGSEMVTGFNIANHYREVSTGSMGSLNKPLTISFSSLFSAKKYGIIARTYNILIHYSIFIILLITGILYFLSPVFLYIIYGESYLDYTIILRLILISVIFGVQGRYFVSLLKASDKVKFLLPFTIFTVTIKILMFLLGLIYFGMVGALYGIIIGNINGFITSTILNFRIFKVKLSILKTISQYVFFFIALFFSMFLGYLFLNNLNYLILERLNLILFKDFEVLSLLVFLLIHFVLIIVFKIITVSDIEIIEGIFNKDKKLHRFIIKGLNILKKIVRK